MNNHDTHLSTIRKRKVSKRRAHVGLLTELRGTKGGVLTFALMLLVAVGYVGQGTYTAAQAAGEYAGLPMGADRQQVRYLLGPPPAAQALTAHWTYPSSAATYAVGFDAGGRMEHILCASAGQTLSLCPPVFGIVPGMGESDVTTGLGPATGITFVGNDKHRNYDGLGVTFILSQRQVISVEHHRPAYGPDFVHFVLWQLLP
jgi:hypothetical protein